MKKLIILFLSLLLIWLTQCDHFEPDRINMHVNDLSGIMVLHKGAKPVIVIGQYNGDMLSNPFLRCDQK